MLQGILVIAGLGILVLLHEIGHGVAAKVFGLGITDFSIGLGPSVFARPMGGVTLRIGVVPLGGFVRVEELSPGPPRNGLRASASSRFAPKAVVARVATVGAGSLSNLLVAALLATTVAFVFGVETGEIAGLEVTASSGGGVEVGDVLTHVEGRPVRHVRELSNLLGSKGGEPVGATVLREGDRLGVVATPREAHGRYGLGARYVAHPDLRRPTLTEGLVWGAAFPFRRAGELAQRAAMMVSPGSSVRPVSAVGLVDRVSRSGEWSPRRGLLFAALLSVVVGLFNLLPFPGLDGGRLSIEAVETLRRKRLRPQVAVGVQVAGALVLLVGWAAIVVADVLHLR